MCTARDLLFSIVLDVCCAQVLDIYAVVQKGFPDSKLIASTFDAFTAPLLEVQSQPPYCR